MYTPEKLVSDHREMGEKVDWWIYKDLRRKVNCSFVESKNWNGLIEFYDEVLDLTNLKEQYSSEIRKMDYESYSASMKIALANSLQTAAANKNVKSIYFEYEHGQANFFLCTKYKVLDDSDWAAYFDEVIEAPELYFPFDVMSDDILNWQFSLIYDYLAGRICAILGQVVDELKPLLPIAMAEHDHEITHFC